MTSASYDRCEDGSVSATRVVQATFSVVVCVHNGARRLPLTLEALSRVRYGGSWEVIVVDNASTDDTAQVAAGWTGSFTAFSLVAETTPGLWHARLKGISEAKFEFIAFVDDDNILAPDYLEVASKVLCEHHDIALLNGRSELHPLGKVPSWFEDVKHCYAVGAQMQASGLVPAGAALWGAGLVLRKIAFEELMLSGFRPLLVGRSGGKMLAGDDSELCYALRLLGWEAYYCTDMVLHHAIDPSKFDLEVLKRMAEGFGQMWIVLMMYRTFKDSPFRRALKLNLVTLIGGLSLRLAGAALRIVCRPGNVQARVDFWKYATAVRQLTSDWQLPRRVVSAPFFEDIRKLGERNR